VGEAGSGNPKPETFAFKDDHLTLLAELAGHDRLVKATELDGLSGMPPIDKMRKLLGELERAGFVRRPSGANSGYGITADGRAELSRRNMLPD
jgi:DNA-binding IscR family transcriptional regulator